MDQVMSYIFASLKNTNSAINEIDRVLKRQNKINRKFFVMLLAGAAYIYTAEKRNKKEQEHTRKIVDGLTKDIVSLQCEKKGDQEM